MAQKKLLYVLIFGMIWIFYALNHVEAKEYQSNLDDIKSIRKLYQNTYNQNMKGFLDQWHLLEKIQKSNSQNPVAEEIRGISLVREDQPILRIFVSESMGRSLLKQYAVESRKYNAILIFNGLPDGSFHKFSDLIYEISDIDEENLEIQIDDTAFQRYDISVVPSFVVTMEGSILSLGNEDTETKNKFDKVSGNIGIKRALEIISDNGELSEAASTLLNERITK